MYTKKVIVLFVAVFINVFLLSSLAAISSQDNEERTMVNFVQRPVSFFPLEEDEVINKQKKEDIKEKISELRPDVMIAQVKKLNFEMDFPKIDLQINPAIKSKIDFKVEEPQLNQLYAVSDLDKAPMPKFRRGPVYPYRARRLNIEGEVVLRFIVTSRGDVNQIKVIRSTPPGVFEKSAINCVSSWKFSPGELSGSRVNSIFIVPLKYKLKS